MPTCRQVCEALVNAFNEPRRPFGIAHIVDMARQALREPAPDQIRGTVTGNIMVGIASRDLAAGEAVSEADLVEPLTAKNPPFPKWWFDDGSVLPGGILTAAPSVPNETAKRVQDFADTALAMLGTFGARVTDHIGVGDYVGVALLKNGGQVIGVTAYPTASIESAFGYAKKACKKGERLGLSDIMVLATATSMPTTIGPVNPGENGIRFDERPLIYDEQPRSHGHAWNHPGELKRLCTDCGRWRAVGEPECACANGETGVLFDERPRSQQTVQYCANCGRWRPSEKTQCGCGATGNAEHGVLFNGLCDDKGHPGERQVAVAQPGPILLPASHLAANFIVTDPPAAAELIVPQDKPECTCKSLLNGHETNCPLNRS